MGCDLCAHDPRTPLWQDAVCRVALVVEERGYPGFCRVIWNAHVREMTDLGERERAHLMRVVFAAESALRELLNPHKINLASLGNMTPHVHWHVIPRFENDPHFPQSVWGPQQRGTQPEVPPGLAGRLAAALASRLG
jgi:diadenosine tetraphosphate (Ap4A) HIT family hydrolase